ncbi:ead/Ea22-like family protein [Brevibacillus laterosporus]|uniref:Ead/Ea22-like family protein n=2 Tax=Brevibacillus laterosporus TaxID=1465 RepID=A0AAP3DKE1_BRELA|nr:ead/Ea22-like family protein [Brevibacillus laterosporus]MCR8982286.1 ead/Ea22-like family protein [Brevibacillus laterosporus]MCZ0809441.1 ead/Ea22-like family protein [Brevibacillus laterosporus]MCZ0827844.1 ead/Ea22-like family protein [Brevibacillus laterosporus]
MMTREEIGAIRERAEKATPGPWRREFSYGITIASDKYIVLDDEVGVIRYPDAEFIAHAREDIPKLLTEIERLQTNWQRLEEYVDDWRGEAFEAHDASEGGGARYFYGGRSGAFTNVQDMIHALEWEGDEC